MPAELEAAMAKAWMEVLAAVGWLLIAIAGGCLLLIAVCALVNLLGAARRARVRAAAVTRIDAYYRELGAGPQTHEPPAEDVDFVLQYLLAERTHGGRPGRQVYRD